MSLMYLVPPGINYLKLIVMMLKKSIEKIDRLIEESMNFLKKVQEAEKSLAARKKLRIGEYSAYTTSVLSTLNTMSPRQNSYLDEYKQNATNYTTESIKNGQDILCRYRKDLEEGWLGDFNGLVSAEIFSNFLEMAENLLIEKY